MLLNFNFLIFVLYELEIYPKFNCNKFNNFSSNDNSLIMIISQIVILMFTMNLMIIPLISFKKIVGYI